MQACTNKLFKIFHTYIYKLDGAQFINLIYLLGCEEKIKIPNSQLFANCNNENGRRAIFPTEGPLGHDPDLLL